MEQDSLITREELVRINTVSLVVPRSYTFMACSFVERLFDGIRLPSDISPCALGNHICSALSTARVFSS